MEKNREKAWYNYYVTDQCLTLKFSPQTHGLRTSCPPGQLLLRSHVPIGQLVLGPCALLRMTYIPASLAILSTKQIANPTYISPRSVGGEGIYATICKWFTSLVAIENQHCPNKLVVASLETTLLHKGRPAGECEARTYKVVTPPR